MLNISLISAQSMLGRALRSLLVFIPASTVLRIQQGPLRGKRWVKGAGVNSYWFGTYELPLQRRFLTYLRPGAVVFDIGAHVGYYTLLAATVVGETGQVVAFEPSARNCPFLRRHLKLNQCRNVTVMDVAVSDRAGTGNFSEGIDSTGGRLSDTADGQVVTTVTIDGAVYGDGLPAPTIIKIDVEGGEAAVLRGAKRTLTEYHPMIIVATHNRLLRQQCLELLSKFGYIVEPIDAANLSQASELFAHARV